VLHILARFRRKTFSSRKTSPANDHL
jgi:hypothetical protein